MSALLCYLRAIARVLTQLYRDCRAAAIRDRRRAWARRHDFPY